MYFRANKFYREANEPFPFEPRLVDTTITLIDTLSSVHSSRATIVDVGCGFGRLVFALRSRGLEAYGCDVSKDWQEQSDYLSLIQLSPYRLPFEDETIDVVVTNSILEHVQDHRSLYKEMHRVLKPGGCAIHIYPGRWYTMLGRFLLPVEPHIRVPLMHYFWPRPQACPPPKLLFEVSARLGFRSPYQKGKSISQVVNGNIQYAMNSLNYLPHSYHKSLSLEVFGNHESPLDFYYSITYGGAAQLYRKLPCKRFLANLLMQIRHCIMLQRKSCRTLRQSDTLESENVKQ